jgi:hypothetical protein
MITVNKYGSKLDSFIASDLYNLPMPVLPPANLSLASTAFAPSFLFFRTNTGRKVAGFLPTDNAYIRGLGINSNLADGLVPFAAVNDAVSGWNVRFTPQLFAAEIAGISNTVGTDQLTGAGTQFAEFLNIGSVVMWLDDNKCVRTGTVLLIAAGGASLTLAANTTNAGMLTASTTGKSIYVLIKNAGTTLDIPFLMMNTMSSFSFFAWQASTVYAALGKISITTGTAALVGVGTSFVTDYAVGSPIGWLDDVGTRRTGVVLLVNSNTSITLTANALSTATNASIIDINSFIAIKTEMNHTFAAYTITIDPLFGDGTRRLTISVLADIEHTFALPTAGEI